MRPWVRPVCAASARPPGQCVLAVAQKLLCRPEMEAVNVNLSPPHLGSDSETEQSLRVQRMQIACVLLVASTTVASQSV